ncbi:MAG TPA: MltA domain-containing protein [Candidatus Binatia bacterium]|nr:MltA domain-containing protein [Candidatus Binatia bacterium]
MTVFVQSRRSIALSTLLLIAGCGVVRHVTAPTATATRTLSRDECRTVMVDDSDLSSLQRALERSLDYYRRLPEDQAVPLLDRTVTVRELRDVMESLISQPVGANDAARLCDRFALVQALPARPLLITGYYEPELPARRRRSERFRYPIYELPDDLVTVDLTPFCASCTPKRAVGRVRDGELVPYYTRAEIDRGALGEHGSVLAWLDDPVEAFFLHVQGSARLHFDDGVHMEVSYNGSNGRPYTSLGRVLVETGKLALADVSLSSLKTYLRDHPDERDELMQRNERCIFFRTVPVGPVGSLGQPLTAGRSIAADARVYPPGALVLLKSADSAVASRLALLQDAGVAISGDHRLDFFCGTGESAAAAAGGMQAGGELYFVLPK